MTQATEISRAAATVDAATRAAELATDLVEDEREATLYTFDDDSVLVIREQEVSAFADIAAARAALGG